MKTVQRTRRPDERDKDERQRTVEEEEGEENGKEDQTEEERGESTADVSNETVVRELETDGTELEEVMELLSDEYTRRILMALAPGPRPARELMDVCDMSRSTVYRRLNRLQEHGVVASDLAFHREGHHRKVFELRLERFQVEMTDDEPTVRLAVREQSDGAETPTTPI